MRAVIDGSDRPGRPATRKRKFMVSGTIAEASRVRHGAFSDGRPRRSDSGCAVVLRPVVDHRHRVGDLLRGGDDPVSVCQWYPHLRLPEVRRILGWCTSSRPWKPATGIGRGTTRRAARTGRQLPGSSLTPQLAQEVGSQFSTRIEGTCVKHRFGKSSIKMYDKSGIVLRIETTTNDVSFFKHHRRVEHRYSPPPFRTFSPTLRISGLAGSRVAPRA
jgi:hypothetical protein